MRINARRIAEQAINWDIRLKGIWPNNASATIGGSRGGVLEDGCSFRSEFSEGVEGTGGEGASAGVGNSIRVTKLVIVVNCTFTIVNKLMAVVYWTLKIVR